MAETIGEAVIVIGADASKFRRDVEREAKGTLHSVGTGLQSAGRTMTRNVTAPIVGAGLGVLKLAGDFESSMKNVSAITGATGDDFARLQETAKELGRTTVFSASEAAEGMTFLGMAGFDTNEIIGAMPGTLALAAATATDLGTAADIASNVLTGFGMEAAEAGRMADVLAKAASSSNTDIQQLGDAMTYVAPVAAGMGVSLEETTAAIGLMSDAGIQGSMAGTSLRGALARLANPTGKAAKILEDLGVQTKDASGELLPLADIVEQLGESGATTGQLLEVFGDRAGPAMSALVSQGGDALRDLTDTLENAGGTAEQMAETQLEGLNGQMRLLASAGEGLAIAIAESGLLEWVTGIVEGITEWVSALAESNPALLRMVTIVAGLLAVLGPLALIVGKVISGVVYMRAALAVLNTSFLGVIKSTLAWTAALLTNPITWIVVGITALVAALVWFFTKTEAGRAIIQAVWGAIKSAMGAVVDWWTETAAPALIGAWEWVKGAVSAVGDWFSGTLVPILRGVWDAIVAGFEWVKGAVETVGDGLQAAWQAVGDAFGWVYNTLVQPAIDGFHAAVGWLRDNVLPIFKAIGDGFAAVGQFIWDVYSNVIGLAFDLVAFAANWLWENALRPVFDAIKAGFSAVASWFSDRADDIAALWDAMVAALEAAWAWLDRNVFQVFRRVIAALRDWVNARVMDIRRIWEGIKSAFRAVWDWIDRNVFAVFRTGIDNLKTNIGLAVDGAKAVWATLKASFRAVWDWIKSNVFDRFTGGLDTLKDWVEDTVDRIGRLWRGVANLMREPINWVIDTVWNNGLKAAFDNVAQAINSNKRLPAAPTIPRFATGGLARRGWAIVGEEGPELVNFTAPGRVYTAEQTRRMLAGPNNPLAGQWSENNPPHGGVGQWFSDRWSDIKRGASAVGGVIRDAAGNVIEWARGGLAELADLILTPIFNTVSRTVGQWGDIGRLGGDAITNVKDRLVEWIRGEDEKANVPQDPGGRTLRGARPYVNAAAHTLADMVGGIRTMQAFNQSMAGGHPRGLAVDFIDSVSKLNALANAIIRVGGFDRFNYMAWQGRLWSPGRGWRPQGRGYGNDPWHRWHLHAEWFDKGGLLRPGWNMVFNGTGADEHLANVTGLVALLRRGQLPGLEAPPRRESSAPVVVQTGEDSKWSREQMDYLAEKLAAMLWPMARAADHVNDFASMGRTRLRMGGV